MYPGRQWERIEPGTANWSADILARAQAYSAHIGSSAVVVVQHGRVIAQWGDTTHKSDVASIRKSLLSALFGIAIEEGRVRPTDTLARLGIDDKEPSLTEREKQATLADLLTSRSGVYHPTDIEPPTVAAQRPPRGSHPPGSFWYYNNWDFNALGTIYEKAAGESLFQAFERRIAAPIGLQDFTLDDCRYGETKVSNHPHYGFRMSARDLARFGLLYLRAGRWGEQQIMPASWIDASVTAMAHPHTELFPGRGYGYMWWTGFASDWAPTVKLPGGTFYALGFGAQYLFVIPAHDLVVVHTADMERKNWTWVSDFHIGRLMWLILAAAGIGDIGPDTSLAAAAGARLVGDALKNALAGNTLVYADTAPDGPYAMRFSRDGTVSLEKGTPRKLVFVGKWWVDGDKLCRGWSQFQPRFDCWPVAAEGSRVSLHGVDDTLFLQGNLVSE